MRHLAGAVVDGESLSVSIAVRPSPGSDGVGLLHQETVQVAGTRYSVAVAYADGVWRGSWACQCAAAGEGRPCRSAETALEAVYGAVGAHNVRHHRA